MICYCIYLEGQAIMAEELDQTDIDLNNTRGHRQAIVKQLMVENNGKYPTDPKELKVFLQALSDMSKDAISTKRIRVEEKANDTMEQNRQIAAEILKTIVPARMAVQPDVSKAGPIVDTAAIPRPTFVEGELDVRSGGDNYQSFTKRMGMNPD